MKVIVGDKAIELTDEQLELYGKLKTKLQREVALRSLEGLSDAEAYRQGGGKAVGGNSIAVSASEILNNPNVVAFKESFNGYLIASAIMTREEMLARLTVMARTDLTDVVKITNRVVTEGEDGEKIEQSYWALKDVEDMTGASSISELSATKGEIKIKLHDQKTAMKQIADIEGFHAAIRLAHGGDPKGSPITTSTLTQDQALELLKKNDIDTQDE